MVSFSAFIGLFFFCPFHLLFAFCLLPFCFLLGCLLLLRVFCCFAGVRWVMADNRRMEEAAAARYAARVLIWRKLVKHWACWAVIILGL